MPGINGEIWQTKISHKHDYKRLQAMNDDIINCEKIASYVHI